MMVKGMHVMSMGLLSHQQIDHAMPFHATRDGFHDKSHETNDVDSGSPTLGVW
jgi:hypothetical protein